MTSAITNTWATRIEAANRTLIVEGELDAVDRFFRPDYVVHLTAQDLRGGHELVRQALALYHQAFEDIQLELEILLEAGDRLAWQRRLRATHRGGYKGFPASGRTLVWRDMVVSRFDPQGLIAEEWVSTDLAERLLLARKG